MAGITILHGDCREQLQTLPAGSVQTVVTSPPYYGLRKYTDDPREIGQEATPAEYVAALVDVFRQVRRVLRDDGTVWLNLGDSYAQTTVRHRRHLYEPGEGTNRGGFGAGHQSADEWIDNTFSTVGDGIKQKDLLGIPWRVAFALQDDGWYLRSDIIWHKPNCMPESVTDRPTRAHEYVFLLAKNARYFYDAAAIAEPAQSDHASGNGFKRAARVSYQNADGTPRGNDEQWSDVGGTRNRRTVWTIATQPYSGAHYATMPEALIAPSILAGSSAQACEHCGAPWVRVVERESNWQERKADGGTAGNVGTSDTYQNGVHGKNMSHDLGPKAVRDLGFRPSCTCPDNAGSAASVVLDPFGGSGTVGRVAARYQRNAVLIELNGDYITDHIDQRTDKVQIEMFT